MRDVKCVTRAKTLQNTHITEDTITPKSITYESDTEYPSGFDTVAICQERSRLYKHSIFQRQRQRRKPMKMYGDLIRCWVCAADSRRVGGKQ